jgi:hypothetical protein
MKLLLTELNVLRVEVEQFARNAADARNAEEFLTASINQLSESRDQVATRSGAPPRVA